MPTVARTESESKMYHVVTKGMGGQVTFEDDDDCLFFLKRMEEYADEDRITFYAWCLMTNHIHFVIGAEIDDLSRFMQRLGTSYAMVFNKKHVRNGSLFQKAFWSDPIDSDERLLATVRYVHQNPLKPKLALTCAEYQWSSYQEYIGQAKFTNTEYLLAILGSLRNFRDFHHEHDSSTGFLDIDRKRMRRTNAEVLQLAHRELGEQSISNIASLSRPERDEKLRQLKSLGLTHRQIEMITGIGRNIVARA